jgi:hypothetical protein
VLPTLADLDPSRLSDEALAAFQIGSEIADGAELAEVAAKHGLTLDEVKRGLDKLAAEWREQGSATVLPAMTEDEYEALRESIFEHGQLVSIIATHDGEIVDGHARARACRQLGVEPRIESLPPGFEADELKSLALVVNVCRRHVTTASARRGIARAELLRDPSRSDRAIAVAIGVSPTTVGSVRKELEHAGEVSKLDSRVGLNGVEKPSTQPARDPQPQPELPDGLVDVTVRLTREYAADLDGGQWLDCKAVRLVLVAPGAYTLEVRT